MNKGIESRSMEEPARRPHGESEAAPSKTPVPTPESVDVRDGPESSGMPGMRRDAQTARWLRYGGVAAILSLAFAALLIRLVQLALAEDLHSHLLLIPVVSIYLVWQKRPLLPESSVPNWSGMGVFVGIGLALLLAMLAASGGGAAASSDRLALATGAYVAFLTAGGFAVLGGAWMRQLAFPFVFLVFLIPLPDQVVGAFERFLVLGSAEATNVLFELFGLPFIRADRTTFELPAIRAITVAQECSGIRSTWVLFITSVLASHMFLRSQWRRAILIAIVIPLGILRNGVRILTLAMLCVHVDPDMINGVIHNRGGPIFFVASLVPFLALLWWLRSGEHAGTEGESFPQASAGKK